MIKLFLVQNVVLQLKACKTSIRIMESFQSRSKIVRVNRTLIRGRASVEHICSDSVFSFTSVLQIFSLAQAGCTKFVQASTKSVKTNLVQHGGLPDGSTLIAEGSDCDSFTFPTKKSPSSPCKLISVRHRQTRTIKFFLPQRRQLNFYFT